MVKVFNAFHSPQSTVSISESAYALDIDLSTSATSTNIDLKTNDTKLNIDTKANDTSLDVGMSENETCSNVDIKENQADINLNLESNETQLDIDLNPNEKLLDICFKDFYAPGRGMVIRDILLDNNNQLVFYMTNGSTYSVDLSKLAGQIIETSIGSTINGSYALGNIELNTNDILIFTMLDGTVHEIDLSGLKGLTTGGNIIVVDQEDTSDINTALLSEGITEPIDNLLLVIRNSKDETAGYVYRNKKWTAFSGSVGASNVVFKEDIVCAGSYTQVGNITKTNSGTTTIPAKGKTIEDVMKSIFTKELQPTATQPSVNLSFPQAGAYEVGKTVTPTFSASLNSGSYTYGPATGVVATSWSVKDNSGNSDTNNSGSFSAIVVTDTTNYTITAEAAHTAGVIAITNLGGLSSPPIQIAAGSKSKTSSAITGYRSTFYGVVNDVNPLDSTYIRSLTNDGKASSKKITIKVNGNTNAKRILLALPTASGLKIKSVSKTDGLVTDITSTYSKTGTVMVDGANNVGNLVSYDIWTYQPASIDSAEVHEITIG